MKNGAHKGLHYVERKNFIKLSGLCDFFANFALLKNEIPAFAGMTGIFNYEKYKIRQIWLNA